MTLKPKWTSELVGEYERSLKQLKTPEQPPQRTWVGLTDEDLRQIILVAIGVAEAKLKEKNG